MFHIKGIVSGTMYVCDLSGIYRICLTPSHFHLSVSVRSRSQLNPGHYRNAVSVTPCKLYFIRNVCQYGFYLSIIMTFRDIWRPSLGTLDVPCEWWPCMSMMYPNVEIMIIPSWHANIKHFYYNPLYPGYTYHHISHTSCIVLSLYQLSLTKLLLSSITLSAAGLIAF